MTRRAEVFLAANADSPVEYLSADGVGVTYRLTNGKLFNLSRAEAEEVGHPRLAHLANHHQLEAAE